MRAPVGGLLLLLLAVVASAPEAPRARAANGPMPISNSPASTGRGGAELAVVGDAHSVSVNPAGLALLDGPRIDLGAGFYITRSSFTNSRNDDRSGMSFPMPAPALAFGMPIELGEGDGCCETMGFGVALHTIGGGNSKARFRTAAYADGELESTSLLFLGLTAGFAVKVTPRLSLGLGATAIYASLDQTGIVGGGGQTNGLVRNFANGQLDAANPNFLVNGQPITWGRLMESVRAPDTFATSRIEVKDAVGFGGSAILGATFEVTEGLSVGASYRTPGYLSDLEGTAFLDASLSAQAGSGALDSIQSSFLANHLPDGGRNLSSKYSIRLKGIKIPQVAGAGVAFWPHEKILLALDVKWIGWSTAFDEVTILLSRGSSRDLGEITTNGRSGVIRSKVLYHWRDQVVIATGVACTPTDWLVLRAGYNYGSNPIPAKTENPFVAATVEHHLTLGVGFNLDAFSIDVAWVHAFAKSSSIRQSLANPEWSGMRHKADQDAFLLGGTFRF